MKPMHFFLLLTVGAAALLTFYLTRDGVLDKDADSKKRGKLNPGFKHFAKEAGLKFRMAFLPGEQGENFKINLYDHGCGVAVADFDGDGFEDIYFCNQLGKNALYRNLGGGKF